MNCSVFIYVQKFSMKYVMCAYAGSFIEYITEFPASSYINRSRSDTVHYGFYFGTKEEPVLGHARGQEWCSSPCPFSLQLAEDFIAEKYRGMFTSWFSEGHDVLLYPGHHFCPPLFGSHAVWQQVFVFPPRREISRRKLKKRRVTQEKDITQIDQQGTKEQRARDEEK